MNHRISHLCSLMAFFVLAPVWGLGQTAEHHSVEHLEAAELGPFDPVKSPQLDEVKKMIVDQTNQFRQEEGREEVDVNQTLKKAAEDFADYMARTDDYGHRADGRNPSDRAKAKGYDYCLVEENIAYKFKTTGFSTQKLAEGFVKGWKHSPGHRRNMLEPDVTETGVAVAQSETTGVFYAVQMFGRPKSKEITFRVANKTDVSFSYQIADRQFNLPPNYSRKHTLCRPSKLRWLPELNSKAEQQKPREIEPQDGDEFRVTLQEDKVLLKPAETAASS